jgi:hypothetical protein
MSVDVNQGRDEDVEKRVVLSWQLTVIVCFVRDLGAVGTVDVLPLEKQTLLIILVL